MFIKDEFTPDFFKEFNIHKNIIDRLKNIKDNLPNLLFYGPRESGKITIVKALLNEIYNTKIISKKTLFTIKLTNSKEIYVNCNEFYFEILLDKYIIYNKQYIIKLIKNLTNNYEINHKCNFKIIIIKNIDLFDLDFCLYIKNCIEKHYDNLRFIFVTNNISKINNIYKGFFLHIIVPQPSILEKKNLIKFICKKKKVKSINDFPNEFYNCNLKNLLIKFELFINNNNYIFYENKNLETLKNLILEKKLKNILLIRDFLYELMAKNYNIILLLNDLLKFLLNTSKITKKKKFKIIELYSEFSRNIPKSYKNIILIESLCINIMNIL